MTKSANQFNRDKQYVQHYRLFFRNAESTNRLWLSQLGRPLTDSSLYRPICKRTRDAFGKQINPQPGNQHCRPSRGRDRIGHDCA